MHITDWLPTLYNAAGGELGDLDGPIDGVNQWPTIAQGAKTPRTSTLLNIDEVLKLEAATDGRYKLLKGILTADPYCTPIVNHDLLRKRLSERRAAS